MKIDIDINKSSRLCCNCSHADSCDLLVTHNNPKKGCDRFEHKAKPLYTAMMIERAQDSVVINNLCTYCKNINVCEKKNDRSDIQDCPNFGVTIQRNS